MLEYTSSLIPVDLEVALDFVNLTRDEASSPDPDRSLINCENLEINKNQKKILKILIELKKYDQIMLPYNIYEYQEILKLALFSEDHYNRSERENLNISLVISLVIKKSDSISNESIIYEIRTSKAEDSFPTGSYNWIELQDERDRKNCFKLNVYSQISENIILVYDGKNSDFSFSKQFQKKHGYRLSSVEYNNHTIQCNYHAIENITDEIFKSLMFRYCCKELQSFYSPINISNICWGNTLIRNNQVQMTAVLQILKKSSYSSPYILFGPPGTGKTETIIEAIYQIINHDAHNNVLVCCQSNAGVDIIAEKISKYENLRKFTIRLRPQDSLIRKLVKDKRIIICTLCFSIKFVLNNIMKFSYLFIDDAEKASELNALIPIVLNTKATYQHEKMFIVMSGDPKKLGPVVKSNIAKPIIGRSLLERLIQQAPYIPIDFHKNNRDPNYVTELTKNYRNPIEIIELSNDLFYKYPLNKCTDQASDQEYRFRDKSSFPIIFFHTEGEEKKSAFSKGVLFNDTEVNAVITFIKDTMLEKRIKQENVGIITVFTSQRNVFKKKLEHNNLQRIIFGTVENFQSAEKEYIIVSTVRNEVFGSFRGKKHLGLLSDPKRFNELITKAKTCLVIFGNAQVLSQDKNWLRLIHLCIKNKRFYSDKETNFKPSKYLNESDSIHPKILQAREAIRILHEYKNIIDNIDFPDEDENLNSSYVAQNETTSSKITRQFSTRQYWSKYYEDDIVSFDDECIRPVNKTKANSLRNKSQACTNKNAETMKNDTKYKYHSQNLKNTVNNLEPETKKIKKTKYAYVYNQTEFYDSYNKNWSTTYFNTQNLNERRKSSEEKEKKAKKNEKPNSNILFIMLKFFGKCCCIIFKIIFHVTVRVVSITSGILCFLIPLLIKMLKFIAKCGLQILKIVLCVSGITAVSVFEFLVFSIPLLFKMLIFIAICSLKSLKIILCVSGMTAVSVFNILRLFFVSIFALPIPLNIIMFITASVTVTYWTKVFLEGIYNFSKNIISSSHNFVKGIFSSSCNFFYRSLISYFF